MINGGVRHAIGLALRAGRAGRAARWSRRSGTSSPRRAAPLARAARAAPCARHPQEFKGESDDEVPNCSDHRRWCRRHVRGRAARAARLAGHRGRAHRSGRRPQRGPRTSAATSCRAARCRSSSPARCRRSARRSARSSRSARSARPGSGSRAASEFVQLPARGGIKKMLEMFARVKGGDKAGAMAQVGLQMAMARDRRGLQGPGRQSPKARTGRPSANGCSRHTDNAELLALFHAITSAVSAVNDFEYPARHWFAHFSSKRSMRAWTSSAWWPAVSRPWPRARRRDPRMRRRDPPRTRRCGGSSPRTAARPASRSRAGRRP